LNEMLKIASNARAAETPPHVAVQCANRVQRRAMLKFAPAEVGTTRRFVYGAC
jgi:hypothetical protein